jgi:hypothetical protein
MDGKATIHTIGAFVLFSNVVYFCLVAFLRSLNQKLLEYAALKENSEFVDHVNAIRKAKSRDDVNLLQKFWNFLTLESQVFLAIAAEQSRRYDRENRAMRIVRLLLVHGKKFARGYVNLVCGALIALTLLTFILLSLSCPGA